MGSIITWITATSAAYFILHFEFKLALLFGAILIVTGPTVILPLLRQIRPGGNLYAIAKWEGIMIDPVGAVLAVLVFEEIISGGFEHINANSIGGLILTLAVGLFLGWIGARLIIIFLQRYWIPDFLHNSMAIMMVISTFILSDLIQKESGLLTVTVLGILLANQNKVSIKHIIEFKENLRIILISTLFIILAARLKIDDLAYLNRETLIFIAVLVFIARPLGVYISTIGQNLNFKEKLFLSWLAPRGIVAAAVSSVFAIELTAHGYSDAARLVPLTFIIIIATVTLYGLTAVPLARWLHLSEPDPQGALIVGAQIWTLELAKVLKKAGVRVLLVDANQDNVLTARHHRIEAKAANILSEEVIDQLDLQGIGKLLALTPNDEVNALAALHFEVIFGRAEVYQLPYKKKLLSEEQPVSRHLRGRRLFAEDLTFEKINELFTAGALINMRKIEEEKDIQLPDNDKVIPMMLVDAQKKLIIYTEDRKPKPMPGMHLIYLRTA